VNNKFYRTVWISDLHLGTRACQAEALLDFLRSACFDTLYLVGDIIDLWALKRGIYWPQTHNVVLQKLLLCARKGVRIIYIPGNHDELVSRFCGQYGNVTIQRRAIHTTANGKKLLVIHGHEMDTIVQNLRWLAHVGDLGYKSLMRVNGFVNFICKRLGMRYWSLSAFVKREVKNVVSFINQFEHSVVRYAKEFRVSGVICGHIHFPAYKTIEDMLYINCGDWVESNSLLVEDSDGSLQIIRQNNVPLRSSRQTAPETLPKRGLAETVHTFPHKDSQLGTNYPKNVNFPFSQPTDPKTKWIRTIHFQPK